MNAHTEDHEHSRVSEHEVELLARRTGQSPGEIRKLLQDTGGDKALLLATFKSAILARR